MSTSASAPTLIRNVAVFDGTKLHAPQDVLIDGPVIVAVGSALGTPAGATVVDGSARTLLPGLIDAHTHTSDTEQLRRALLFGITTELDMGGTPSVARAVREAARERDDLADLRIATTGATAPGGHPSQLVELGLMAPFPTVTGPEDADAFVAARVADPQWLKEIERMRSDGPGEDEVRVGPVSVDARYAADVALRMFRAGVPLLAGTDGTGGAGHPTTHGISYHGELALLVAAGLTPAQALTAATAAPADAFGLHDRGRVAAGLRADLLLVEGNPLADITAVRDITALWRLGVPVNRTAALLADGLV